MAITLSDFDIITFDCYGTLIDWEAGMTAAFQMAAARDRLTLEPEQIVAAYMTEEPRVEAEGYRPYREVLGLTAQRVAARLGWEITEERAGFLADSLAEWRPFTDTVPALKRLAQRFSLGILSNVDDDLLAQTRLHLEANFELIVTAQQVRSYKPGSAHFLEALRRAGGRRILHAAQSHFHDVAPACSLGIGAAWVNRKGEQTPSGGPRPAIEVRNLTELADLLGA